MTTFKSFEQQAWEAKAGRYQSTWGTVTMQPISAVLAAARIERGSQLLDCGAGPGTLCHEASLLGAEVVGCDYSQEMVRIASAHYPELEFFHGDAERLSFGDCSFDAVTLNYLLLHVAEPERALCEAARVLRPGGRLVYTLWLPPTQSPGLKLIFDAIKAYADSSVIPPAGDIFLYSDPAKAIGSLEQIGFKEISCSEFPSFWEVESAEQFFGAVQAGTRMGGLIDLQEPKVKEQIRQHIAQNIEVFKADACYRIPTPSLIVAATR